MPNNTIQSTAYTLRVPAVTDGRRSADKMKSPLPLIIGWISGSLVSAFTICALALAEELLSVHNMPPLGEIFTGIAFWSVGVGIAMIPGVILGAILYYRTDVMRGPLSWLWAGFIGAGVMCAWAIGFGFGGDIFDESLNTLLLGGGAFVSASLFWYITTKLESKQNKSVEATA